jgi:UDPglucose 6-dehydrogenase
VAWGLIFEDFMRPDRIVIGTYPDASGQMAKDLLKKLYAPFNRHHERTYWMDVRSAELTKYAANAMLATRISFMNELANMADAVGADIEAVRQGIGSDSRIGYGFLYAGTGYGGSCFPKDVQALIKTAEEHGQELKVLSAVELANQAQKKILVEKITAQFGKDLHSKCFAMWGLAFKPNTDDMRAAPSREIIQALVAAGAHVQVYDPVAIDEARHSLSLDFSSEPSLLKKISYAVNMYDVLNQADALVIVTEWKEFRSPDFSIVIEKLKSPYIFDGRNLYEPSEMKNLGIQYQGIGRS